jgi:hypothetical protein
MAMRLGSNRSESAVELRPASAPRHVPRAPESMRTPTTSTRCTTPLAAAVLLVLVGIAPAAAFELVAPHQRVAPAITAAPIDVVLWIRDTVSDDDAAWVTDEIAAGVALWDDVPTAGLSFAVRTIRSATRPAVDPNALLVVVANRADLASGGTTPPNGRPGEWRGALADFRSHCTAPCNPFRIVAAHEIGHALGVLHSTVSAQQYDDGIPLMHFAAGTAGLSPDDVAAISVAYPHPTHPLAAVTGTLRGRCTDTTTAAHVNGVNVVAVDTATGTPTVGRLSGTEDGSGGFTLPGLPPGTYELHFLDGTSFGGRFFGLAPSLVQIDNFTPFTFGPFTVAAGDDFDLGTVEIPIAPLAVAPDADALPIATAGTTYDATVALHGGIRPLTLRGADGLPAGLTGSVAILDPAASGVGGSALRLRGVPAALGAFRASLIVGDAHGRETALAVDLRVTDTVPDPLCAAAAPIADTRLTLSNLRKAIGAQALTVTGTFVLPPAHAAALDPTRDGVQLRIDDVDSGGATVLALTTAGGTAIPPAGASCGGRDGWRARAGRYVYRNRSGALAAPSCRAGSANGLQLLELRADRRQPGRVRFKLRTRRSTLATMPTGALRVTLVLGAGADTTGCASTHAFAAPPCTPRARGNQLRCG